MDHHMNEHENVFKSWIERRQKDTRSLDVKYKTDTGLPIAYSDSDWGGQLTGNRRSVSAYVVMLSKGPISWRFQKQASVALSSNEAEYMAASETTREAVWIRNLISDMGVMGSEMPPIEMRIDSKSVDDMTNSDLTTNCNCACKSSR
jgi:hypothetical protein